MPRAPRPSDCELSAHATNGLSQPVCCTVHVLHRTGSACHGSMISDDTTKVKAVACLMILEAWLNMSCSNGQACMFVIHRHKAGRWLQSECPPHSVNTPTQFCTKCLETYIDGCHKDPGKCKTVMWMHGDGYKCSQTDGLICVLHLACFAWLAGHDGTPRMHRQACGSDVHLGYNNRDAQWTADCGTEHSTAHLLELAQHHEASAAPAKNNSDTMSASGD